VRHSTLKCDVVLICLLSSVLFLHIDKGWMRLKFGTCLTNKKTATRGHI
jgi:hypothetical protein